MNLASERISKELKTSYLRIMENLLDQILQNLLKLLYAGFSYELDISVDWTEKSISILTRFQFQLILAPKNVYAQKIKGEMNFDCRVILLTKFELWIWQFQ